MWLIVLLAATMLVLPWLSLKRFNVRTLLTVTTVVAVALWIAFYALRY
jgi:hypothetical protein